MALIITILAFIFVIGLVIGSFLNVVILRTISGESIIFPASHCPKCNTPLKWYHNIPVLSYLFLGGKCAFCHEVISLQYPVVELLTGLIFLWLGYLYVDPIINSSSGNLVYLLMLIVSLIASSLFIVISGTDILKMEVAELHTYLLAGTGFLYSLIIGGLGYYQAYKIHSERISTLLVPVLCTIIMTVCAFIFMELLRRGLNHFLKTETFGDGDSYIFAGVISIIVSMFGGNDVLYLTKILFAAFFGSVVLAVIFSIPAYIKTLVARKNWYLLSLLSSFLIYSLGYFYGNTHGWLNNTVVLVLCTLILFILAVALCYELLKGIKENPVNANLLPFGPALCASGFIAIVVMPIVLGLV